MNSLEATGRVLLNVHASWLIWHVLWMEVNIHQTSNRELSSVTCVSDDMQWTAFIMTLIGQHYSDNNHYLVYCVSITAFLATALVMRGALLFQEAYRSAESFKNLSECDGFWILP